MLDDHYKKLVEEIFSRHPCSDISIPPTAENRWAYGMSNYKPFSMQYRQCNENGNIIHEDCFMSGHKLIICKKYGGQCNSGKCRKDRIREGGDKQCTLF